MLCMFVQGILFFFITLLIQYRVFLKIQQLFWKLVSTRDALQVKGTTDTENEDIDVTHERDRILKTDQDNLNDVLIVNELSKRYTRKGKLAVDHLTFGVKPGECFGLLGNVLIVTIPEKQELHTTKNPIFWTKINLNLLRPKKYLNLSSRLEKLENQC
jgi:hypothetical protein